MTPAGQRYFWIHSPCCALARVCALDYLVAYTKPLLFSPADHASLFESSSAVTGCVIAESYLYWAENLVTFVVP